MGSGSAVISLSRCRNGGSATQGDLNSTSGHVPNANVCQALSWAQGLPWE